MPLYDFRCGHCGYEEEILTNSHSLKRTKCPDCNCWIGRIEVNRVGFELMGEGWGKHGYSKLSEEMDAEFGEVDKSEYE
jgi:putative FmdB family regulatory protein